MYAVQAYLWVYVSAWIYVSVYALCKLTVTSLSYFSKALTVKSLALHTIKKLNESIVEFWKISMRI